MNLKNLIQTVFVFTMFILVGGCGSTSENNTETENNFVKAGRYRAEMHMKGQTLPFTIELTKFDNQNYLMTFVNGEERMPSDTFSIVNDSAKVTLNIFDSAFEIVFNNDSFKGEFVKYYKKDDYRIPIEGELSNDPEFQLNNKEAVKIAEKYSVKFVDEEGIVTESVGEFVQTGNDVKGTFLTPLGDYRFLTGVVDGDSLKLSTFDGDHAFLFLASINENNELTGSFWSGIHWYEDWTAIPDPNATLPDAGELTYMKEGYDSFEFSFPDLEGNMVSVSDEQYDNKVVIIQLLGSWCPNCMDETKFLAEWYNNNQDLPVEIIGLAYEQKDDFEYASGRVSKLKDRLKVDYTILIAGNADKEKAAKTLPMLNNVIAFPTTIVLDKNKDIRYIHTGFSGPGTGDHYIRFAEHFDELINKLANEEI
ncbi:peroxiredoxin family protein [Marinigracilibium pacificum]|uniref:Redoxin family protein n=1 Tax=Marinigracilibium pacificum TaxID=2729599 RepID=A0A848J6I4_9BACT|nr:TlpA disulfide reductase family protein [Marinigracilibium pacificum]NMM50074.1 redoxin family protein [Marinigracilibium pacificum]